MICIERMVLREIQLPLREAFAVSSATTAVRRILLLQVFERSGAHVWSECVAAEEPYYSPETIDTAWLALTQWIACRVLGNYFEAARDVRQVLERNFRGHEMAKAAVEMAFWGMEAELRRVPLATAIGGTRTSVETGISIGIQASAEVLAARVSDAVAAGYRKVKMKIAPGRDVEFIRRVRWETGSAVPLMVDANNAYSLADANTLASFDQFGLMMIEQPLAWDDLVRHAKLQQRLRTPICLDESITSIERAEDMVTLGSGQIINIKPGRVGGFTSAVAIHDYCAAQGIPVWCGGMLESGIGRAYNVALASLPNFTKPGDISPSRRYWDHDIVFPEWRMTDDGMIQVPLHASGIGVDVDDERIEALTVRSAVLTA